MQNKTKNSKGKNMVHNESGAFTLAEVLITLAIIGVVAAMTIPTLVSVNQQRAWDTAASTFNRKLGEALSVMNTQQTLGGLGTTENFVNELSKHIKIIGVCSNDKLSECFESSIVWDNKEKDLSSVRTAGDIGHADWETNLMGVQFGNGVSALVAYNPSCKSDPYSNQTVKVSGSQTNKQGSVSLGTDCMAILYDTTGFSTPNENGRDLRAMNVKFSICTENGRVCVAGPAVSIGGPGTTAINDDGEEYITEEGYNAACGGRNNIISHSDLVEIISEIYNYDASSLGYDGQLLCMEDGCDEENPPWHFNEGKAAKFGLSAGSEIFPEDGCSCYMDTLYFECPCNNPPGVALCKG